MVHFHCLLLSDAFEDGDAKKRGKEEEQSQMQSKSTLLFIREMIDCISIACLCDNIEVHLNFGHDLIRHVGLLVTVHYHEVVNAREEAIREGSSREFAVGGISGDSDVEGLDSEGLLFAAAK